MSGEKRKIYIVMQSNNACGDPDCCGPEREYPVLAVLDKTKIPEQYKDNNVEEVDLIE